MHSELKDGISFGGADESTNNVQRREELRKEYQDLDAETKNQLNSEIDKIMQSAETAGINQNVREGLRSILLSRAMIWDADHPANFFKEHPITFSNQGMVDNGKGAYFQMEYSKATNINDFMTEVANIPKEERQKIGYLHTTENGSKFIVSGSRLEHINGDSGTHPLTPEQWEYVLKALDNPEYILWQDVRGPENGIPISMKLKVPGGYAGVVFDIPPNDENIATITTAAINQEADIDNWLKKRKRIGALGWPHKNVTDRIPYASVIDIIKQELDRVKPEWRQMNDYEVMEALKTEKENKKQDVIDDREYFAALKENDKEKAVTVLKRRAESKGIDNPDLTPIIYNEKGKRIPPSQRFLQKSSDKAKGAIQFSQDGAAVINLFKGADASTVIHETGHYFVEAMARDIENGIANEQQIKDFEALLKYSDLDMDRWNSIREQLRTGNLSDEEKEALQAEVTKVHERLAEAFESYIIEGKAPKRELRHVFNRFAKWLRTVYSSVRQNAQGEEVKEYDPANRNTNAVALTKEVTDVFDRWLAAEEDIAAQETIDGFFAQIPESARNFLSEKSQEQIKDYIARAHDEAVNILTKTYMMNFGKERAAKIAAYKKSARAQAEEAVRNRPLYTAMQMLAEYTDVGKQAPKTIARKYLRSLNNNALDRKEELQNIKF